MNSHSPTNLESVAEYTTASLKDDTDSYRREEVDYSLLDDESSAGSKNQSSGLNLNLIQILILNQQELKREQTLMVGQ